MTDGSAAGLLSEFYTLNYSGRPALDLATVISTCSDRRNRIGRGIGLLNPGYRTALDIGCGPGLATYALSKAGAQATGIDLVESELSRARALASSVGLHVALHCHDLNSPGPLPGDGPYDAAVCLVVLECVIDPTNLLNNIRSVMSTDGQLVVSVGNIVSLRNRIRSLRGIAPYTSEFAGKRNGGFLQSFGPREIREACMAAGLKPIKLTCSGRLWWLRRLWPALLGDDLILLCTPERQQT
jgi:SAM-dependent methyltransferase